MTKHDQPSSAKAPKNTAQNTTRRRLLKAGAASAPIIMTLSAKSALAGAGECISPSAFASIRANPATSHNPDHLAGELGDACHDSSYWQNQSWPGGMEKEAAFSSIFYAPPMIAGKVEGPGGPHTLHYNTMTLQQSLAIQSGAGESIDPSFVRDVVSAYLEVQTGSLKIGTTQADSQEILLDMWQNAIVANSWTTPWHSVWTRADARAWLDILVGNSMLPTP